MTILDYVLSATQTMIENKKPRLSLAIPTYEMNGDGARLLKRSLDALEKQTFKDFEVVVTDNSENDEIEKLCSYYNLDIKYSKYAVKGMAPNTNEAIRKSSGEIVKILYMDDYLYHEEALQEIHENFTSEVNWLATGCIHLKDGELSNQHYPSYNKDIYMGNNTIGSPSVVAIRKSSAIYFDEHMTWLLDCDYYSRMYNKFGEPKLIYDINVVMGLHKNQVTNLLAESAKREELNYMLNKNK